MRLSFGILLTAEEIAHSYRKLNPHAGISLLRSYHKQKKVKTNNKGSFWAFYYFYSKFPNKIVVDAKLSTIFVVEKTKGMHRTKQLTKAEEQVMKILWDLGEGVVKEVVEQFEEPRPAYTTVATVLKVLEKKGFAGHKNIGNVHLYFPLVEKSDYTRVQFSTLLKEYFNGSFPRMATFFARENNLGIADLEEMMKVAARELERERQNKER